jgi:hypothetical protein
VSTKTFFMRKSQLCVRDAKGTFPVEPMQLYRALTLRKRVDHQWYVALVGAHDEYRVTYYAMDYLMVWKEANQAALYTATGEVRIKGHRLPGREHGPEKPGEVLAWTLAKTRGRLVHVSQALSI